MEGITEVPVRAIDPQSTVNVRREGVKENVQKLKGSLERSGFWPDNPITVRRHPDPQSEYQYEYVVGQCRFAAAAELGLETIPAVVLELSDDEALRRSWTENEARGDLLPSEKAYWTEKMYNKFSAEGSPDREALEKTAEWLGVAEATVRNYFPLAFLPDKVQRMINQKRIRQEDGQLIAQKTAEGDEKMVERAEWMAQHGGPARGAAREALQEAPPEASIPDLEQLRQEKLSARERTIESLEIPSVLYDRLIDYGKQRGIDDVRTIISNIIAEALRG